MDQRQMVKQRLRRVVEDSGVQQVTIATRIGRDKQWVYNRIKGPGGIALEDVLDLATGLRMDPCDLACRLLRDNGAMDEEQQLRREGFGVVNRLRRQIAQPTADELLRMIRDVLNQFGTDATAGDATD